MNVDGAFILTETLRKHVQEFFFKITWLGFSTPRSPGDFTYEDPCLRPWQLERLASAPLSGVESLSCELRHPGLSPNVKSLLPSPANFGLF